LYIAAIDKNGTKVPYYVKKLNLQISGYVNILNTDPIKTEAGIATALIQIGDKTDDFEVNVSVDGLVSNKKVFSLK
jgi:beta-galactosidase